MSWRPCPLGAWLVSLLLAPAEFSESDDDGDLLAPNLLAVMLPASWVLQENLLSLSGLLTVLAMTDGHLL